MVKIETYTEQWHKQVDALWRECFPDDPPWNRADIVIPAKMATQPDLLIVAIDGGTAIGCSLAGYDGHRGWVYSIAVRQSYQRQGIGRSLLAEIEKRLKAHGCRKINLQVLSLNLPLVRFYHALGYHSEERISMGKRL